MKGSFKLGKIVGIGVFVHWTFTLLIAYLIFINYREGRNATQIMWTIAFVLAIFVTIFLHELGHALAAKRYNIKTLDITLLPIGGLARLESFPEKPIQELVVAVAGPAVNVAIAILTGLFITIPMDATGFQLQLAEGINSNNFFLQFFIVNIFLAVFNLIPAFPMDGGRMLRAILSIKMQRHRATKVAALIGQALAIGFVVIGFNGNVFLVFIGIFIFLGAQAEAEATRMSFMLKGLLVKDITMKQYETIDAGEPLETAVNKLLNGQSKNFIVTSNNQPFNSLSRDEIIKALTEKGKGATINSVMSPNGERLDASMPVEKAFQEMQTNKKSFLPVYESGQMIGTLDLENILEYIMVKDALGKRKEK